jgi:CIC family chloride channel protein
MRRYEPRSIWTRWLRARLWLLQKLQPTELQATLAWAGLVGFLGALATVAFREGIRGIEWLLTHQHGGMIGGLVHTALMLPWWERLLVPAVGGLVAGVILQVGMHLTRRQSSTDYMEAIALGDGRISVRTSLVKSGASLVTVGSGGSIGREGSMVQLAAMLASGVGRMRSFSTPRLRLLTACGAAAGIAAAYNTPIGGALFVSEIVLGSIAMESLGPLVFASVISNVTINHFMHYQARFSIPPIQFASNWELVLYIVLGLVAGFLGPQFVYLLEQTKHFFNKLDLPRAAKLGLGGLIVGLISIGFPGVWGNGYSMVNSILHSQWAWYPLLLLLVFKIIATAATTGSGATGGVFTPTIFVGTAFGSLFGQGVHLLLPHITSVADTYAVVGMGCFLAATTHAPLTAIIMVFEMTLDYHIVLPLMLACVTAYYTSRAWREDSIYSESLREKNSEQPTADFRTLCVADILKTDPPRVLMRSTLAEIWQLFLRYQVNYVYVVGDNEHFEGVVSLHEIKPALNRGQLASIIVAADLLKSDFPTLTAEMSLSQALSVFVTYRGERLPVVSASPERRLLGVASKTDILLSVQQGLDLGAAAPTVK